MEAGARPYKNDDGRTRWQPVYGTKGLFQMKYSSGKSWMITDSGIFEKGRPALYRSRRRAIRIAKRYERRYRRSNWNKEDALD